jgi:hypothetical protein
VGGSNGKAEITLRSLAEGPPTATPDYRTLPVHAFTAVLQVPNAEEVRAMLAFAPNRVGHVCCLAEPEWQQLLDARIPVSFLPPGLPRLFGVGLHVRSWEQNAQIRSNFFDSAPAQLLLVQKMLGKEIMKSENRKGGRRERTRRENEKREKKEGKLFQLRDKRRPTI